MPIYVVILSAYISVQSGQVVPAHIFFIINSVQYVFESISMLRFTSKKLENKANKSIKHDLIYTYTGFVKCNGTGNTFVTKKYLSLGPMYILP